MSNNLENKIKYYQGSEVQIVSQSHPHFTAIGNVIGGEETAAGVGLRVKRHDTQEEFFVFNASDLKITKRK